jgi:hypothetical protein
MTRTVDRNDLGPAGGLQLCAAEALEARRHDLIEHGGWNQHSVEELWKSR